MTCTTEDIRRLAELSRLEISDAELETRAQELERILGYVHRLSDIDTTHIPEGGMTPNQNEWRPDLVLQKDDVARDLIVGNFPDHQGSALRVPAVFEKPKG